MEYHSFIDPEGNYIGKTKYINGEFIPLPPERVIEDIRFVNHKWRCTFPKVDETEEGYIKFNLNLDKLDRLDNTLLQLEVFCKKNKIESEFIIKEIQFNKFTNVQQKQIIQSIINHGFKDIVFVNGAIPTPQIKCRNYFTYNYNTKRREYNKIYFRRNVNYSFDCNVNVTTSKGADYKLLNNCLENIQERHDNSYVEMNFVIEYIGCNAKCWYCGQQMFPKQKFSQPITNDRSIIPAIKKSIEEALELAKKENVKIGFKIMGGELTILDYDIQDEFVEIINDLIKKGHGITIFSNGILKNAPLLHTKAYYLIHVIDWKNKKLEKKENTKYIIVFTEKDDVKDLENFKKLNKDIPMDIVLNSLASPAFFKEKYDKVASHIHKERDKKHKIYLCRTNYIVSCVRFSKSSKHYEYYGCGCCKRFAANDEISTLLIAKMKCPKTCENAYSML